MVVVVSHTHHYIIYTGIMTCVIRQNKKWHTYESTKKKKNKTITEKIATTLPSSSLSLKPWWWSSSFSLALPDSYEFESNKIEKNNLKMDSSTSQPANLPNQPPPPNESNRNNIDRKKKLLSEWKNKKTSQQLVFSFFSLSHHHHQRYRKKNYTKKTRIKANMIVWSGDF